METNAYIDLDGLRMQASELIFSMLGGAPVVTIQYSGTGAFGQCMWADGATQCMQVDYQQLAKQIKQETVP